jgi:hypothetical protein
MYIIYYAPPKILPDVLLAPATATVNRCCVLCIIQATVRVQAVYCIVAQIGGGVIIYISPLVSSWTPGAFYTCFYNHAHRPRLKKLLHLGLSRSPGGFLKPLLDLDPGGGFTSETETVVAARRFQKRMLIYAPIYQYAPCIKVLVILR